MSLSDSSDPDSPATAEPSVFRHRGFLFYWIARILVNFATQIISVAVGWQVYDLTRDPFDLGIVGLVQFLPSLLLVLVTGAAADRYNRRAIMAICLSLEAIVCAGLLAFVWSGAREVGFIFAMLVIFGISRAFMGPATQSLLPNLVPPAELSRAIAWNSSSWQIATITGPVAGGLLYGVSEYAAYGTALLLMAVGMVLVSAIPRPVQRTSGQAKSLETLFAGFRYVWSEKVVLGAISLDLFAVFLGGAMALLPVYARDILHAGPWGLGLLRAAPGVGALLVAAWLTRHTIRDHAGVLMFLFVIGFGAFTSLFGASSLIWLSVIALAAAGACDMVSVYVRQTLIQLRTPDDVRGRVNAVNMVFVGASNELGEFRAGVSAALFGAVPAVVFGGVGTIAVAILWAMWFPQLRKIRHLDGAR
ncbi:MFS transporter [Taklimakanibacter lacteus]|uniref:MFS transporter n=1 Tax=Taklimakanibacter lacteus TaxID=2268456 RepID=UPI000E66084C